MLTYIVIKATAYSQFQDKKRGRYSLAAPFQETSHPVLKGRANLFLLVVDDLCLDYVSLLFLLLRGFLGLSGRSLVHGLGQLVG